PDSFSDGGRWLGRDAALAHAREMIEAGADLIDIGGESTRPGAEPVSEQEELDRVMPVLEALTGEFDVPVSVDTCKPAVMSEAVAAGAALINDVRALRAEGALDAVADAPVLVCLMHMQGEPRTMQENPRYEDVVGDLLAFFRERISACEEAGIDAGRLIIDPGFGFGKTLAHNLELLRRLDAFHALGLPLLAGLSRKRMIGTLLGDVPVDARLHGSVAAALVAALKGARIVRVHDVRETVEALRVADAVSFGPDGVSNG
ncbi:MAG: dihydropteroate synthase, partial [Gammaproteobacteria bacterium]